MTVNEAILRHTRCILSAASQIICVAFAVIALHRTLITFICESGEGMNGTYEAEIQGNKRQLLNKRRRKRNGPRVPKSSAKKKLVHSKVVCPPTTYFVLMLCLLLCVGDAFASSIEETSSFSAIARTSTDIAQNDLSMMEGEGGGTMERVTTTANGAAAVVASSNAELTSRNVFVDAVDGAAATTTMEMYQEQITAQIEQTERLKNEVAQLRLDRDQCRSHAIEKGHVVPPISVDESTTALVDPMTMPIPVAPEVQPQKIIHRRQTNTTIVKKIDTTLMTTNVAVDINSAVDSLLQQLQEALRLVPNVHSAEPAEKIFLAAMRNDILAQWCRTRSTMSHQVQSKVIGGEGSKSTSTASSGSNSGKLLCEQLIQLQKEVLQVLAKDKVSKDETVVKQVHVVMEKVVEVLNTYFSQNPIMKMRRNELTMPALGRRLKRKGSGVVVASGSRGRRLAACPTIYTAEAAEVQGTGGWNVWSASCAMGSQYTVVTGKTVKIKKSLSMSGELVIDRGGGGRHFLVKGTLEMEDVTLTGGHANGVSSFCSLYSLRLFVPIV